MKYIREQLVSLLFGLVLPWLVFIAQGYAAAGTNAAWPQGISTHTLDNGLTVIVQENHQQQLIAFEIIVKTGSLFEQNQQGSGIAHLVEHMLFKGTRLRPVGAIEREVRSLGGIINGYTNHEYTGYTLVLPAHNFDRGVALLTDMLRNPVFDELELAKEKEVIGSEIRMNRDDPQRYIYDLFFRKAYGNAPYNLPVIGLEPLLRQLQRSDVIEFYRRWYVPNNMTMAISGDITAAAALDTLRRACADYSMQPFPQNALPAAARVSGPSHYEETYPVQNARLVIGFSGTGLTDADAPVLDIIAALLGQGESSRLYSGLVKKKKLLYSVDAFNYTPGFRGIFAITGVLENSNKNDVIDAVAEELERLKKTPVGRKELDKAKSMCVSEYVFRQETVESQASSLASDYVYSNDPLFSQRYRSALQKVNAGDIQRCARTYFPADSMITIMLSPEGAAPKAESPGPNSGPIKPFRLDNGVRVLLKQNPTQPVVSIQVCIGGGTRWENESDNGKFRLLSTMLLSGTKTRSAAAIAESFAARGALISSFSGYNSFGISAQCLKPDFSATIEALSDIVLNPVFPETELKLQKSLTLKNIRMNQDDIFENSLQVLKKNMFGSYPYRLDPLGTEASVTALNREQLAATYRKFLKAQNVVVAIFGDIDEPEARRFADKFFSSIPAEESLNQPLFCEPQKQAQNLFIQQPDKQQAVVMFGFPGADVHSNDHYALELINALLTSPGSKLYEHIREREGLSYALGGSSVSGLDSGYFLVYAATAPANAGQVRSIIEAEIAELIRTPVDEKLIANAREYSIGQHRIGLQSNTALSFTAALDELYGRGAEYYRQYDTRMNELTGDMLQKAAARYLQKEKSVVVVTNGQ
ncbi:MAG: pitrilysin family protein [Candidatus Omnitrophica bacterium]|nr:pitrilysin family protein [Candidatus Omnitrophota bacterium]